MGTWSTSEVGRPQTPPPAAPALPPFQPNQCPAAPPAPLTFLHFNNQTLRQIVHTSIGGSSVRVVLSNAYGSAPLTNRRGSHRAARQRSVDRARLGSPAHFQRQIHNRDSRLRA